MPSGSRCPVSQGGCGTFAKVPRRAAPGTVPARQERAAAPAPPETAAWDPPSEPRGPYRTSEPCPECGEALIAEPRGIWRACGTCVRPVTPPGISAPYAAGSARQRQVRSQRERDLEAIALARRKGVMLAQLGALAADGRLHPESLPVVEWFRDQVKDAGTDGRLDDLAGLLPEAGISRRRWWQGQPAVIGPSRYDDEEDQGVPEWEAAPRAIEAPPAVAVAGYAAELAARGWVLQPHGMGTCHVVELAPHGWSGVPPEPCLRRASRIIPGGMICGSHDRAVTVRSA